MVVPLRRSAAYSVLLIILFNATPLLASNQLGNRHDDLISFKSTMTVSIGSSLEKAQTFTASFSILKEANQYVALSENQIYCGIKKEDDWRQPISDSVLSRLRDFLITLKENPFEPQPPSFIHEGYTVFYKGKTYKVRQPFILTSGQSTEWLKETFILNLYADIFEKQITRFIAREQQYRAKVDELIARKWYFDEGHDQNLQKGDTLEFTSTPVHGGLHYWVINKDLSFGHAQRTDLDKDARVAIEYHLTPSSPHYRYLAVYGIDKLVHRLDSEVWEQSSFYILDINEERLLLQIAY